MVSMLASSVVDRGFIGGAMVSMLASSGVDRGFEPWSGQTKDYEIGIYCFSAKHAALRRKSKDWLAPMLKLKTHSGFHDLFRFWYV
jgi:hypothetical protein